MVEMDAGAVRSLRGSGSAKRNVKPGSRRIEGRNILALVPQAARRQHEVLLPARSAGCRSTPVVNGEDPLAKAVSSSSFSGKGDGRRDDRIGPAQSGGDKVAAPL